MRDGHASVQRCKQTGWEDWWVLRQAPQRSPNSAHLLHVLTSQLPDGPLNKELSLLQHMKQGTSDYLGVNSKEWHSVLPWMWRRKMGVLSSVSRERWWSPGLPCRDAGPWDKEAQVACKWPGYGCWVGWSQADYLESLCLLGVQYPKLLISQTLLFSSDHRAALILEERGSEMRNFALSDYLTLSRQTYVIFFLHSSWLTSISSHLHTQPHLPSVIRF